MATQQSLDGQHCSLDGAVLHDSLSGVLRAGGSEATRGGSEGRDGRLVEADGKEEELCAHTAQPLQRFIHVIPPLVLGRSVPSVASAVVA